MKADLRKEHQWLEQMVGEWHFESECGMGPGQPAMKSTGTETVRSLGGAWTLGEGKGEMPGGGTGLTLMTLGYDPARGRFVGTFIGSMMTHLWQYEGALDAEGKVLTLDTEGPDFVTPGKMVKYKDVIEMVGPGHRTLTSVALGDDGNWREVMKAHYRRAA